MERTTIWPRCSQAARTGVLGGFTTFSAFSLDAALLWERGQFALAGMYVCGSVAAGIAGVFAGLGVMRSWMS